MNVSGFEQNERYFHSPRLPQRVTVRGRKVHNRVISPKRKSHPLPEERFCMEAGRTSKAGRLSYGR